jgi:hypothetical protein
MKKRFKNLEKKLNPFFCSGIFLNHISVFSEIFSGQKIRGGTVFD